MPSLMAPLCFVLGGCSTLSTAIQPVVNSTPSQGMVSLGAPVSIGTFQQVAHHLPSDRTTVLDDRSFEGVAELSPEIVVEQVLARNPSLAQTVATWQAASARYPQVTSLEDPMLGLSAAPGAFGSNQLQGGYRIEASQKIPFFGKRALRGANALAEASAADHDIGDMRLQLAEAARAAFYDLYLAERGLEVNDESLDLLKKFKQSAETRYKTGAPRQDMLQADVELARETERRLQVEQMRKVAIARINTLMHLPPDSLLPPLPRRVNP